MAQLTIDLSGRLGMAPRFFGDMNGNLEPDKVYLANDGQMAGGVYNPIKHFGYMSPATNTFTSVTEAANTFSNHFTATVLQNEGHAFYAEATAQEGLWSQAGPSDLTLTREIDFTANNETFTDLEVYQINGKQKLFYAYHGDINEGDIGIANIPFASSDNDWLSTAPTGAFDIQPDGLGRDFIMVVADNGFMYVCDTVLASGTSAGVARVHKIDGTTDGGSNGTVTEAVLTFPAGYQIKDAVDHRGKLYMAMQSGLNASSNTGAFSLGLTGVYIWDRITASAQIQDFVPLRGVKDVKQIYVTGSGKVRVIVESNERLLEIREFNGAAFTVIARAGVDAWGQYRDSLIQMGDLTVWLGRDAIMYAHGRIDPSLPEGLYRIGDMTDIYTASSTSRSPGAILYNDNAAALRQAVFVSLQDSDDVYVKKWYPHGTGSIDSNNQVQLQGDIYTPVRHLPAMSDVNYIDIYMAKTTETGTDTQVTVKIYFNQSTTTFASKVIRTVDGNDAFHRIEINKSYVNAVQLEFEYAANNMDDGRDIRPSFCIVDYNETGGKG